MGKDKGMVRDMDMDMDSRSRRPRSRTGVFLSPHHRGHHHGHCHDHHHSHHHSHHHGHHHRRLHGYFPRRHHHHHDRRRRHGRLRRHHPSGFRRTSRRGRCAEGAGRSRGQAGRRRTSSQSSRALGLLGCCRHPVPSASPTRPGRHGRTRALAARGCPDRACRPSLPRRTPPQARWQPRRQRWLPSPRPDRGGLVSLSAGTCTRRGKRAERERGRQQGRERGGSQA